MTATATQTRVAVDLARVMTSTNFVINNATSSMFVDITKCFKKTCLRNKPRAVFFSALLLVMSIAASGSTTAPVNLKISGDWTVKVSTKAAPAAVTVLQIAPPTLITVNAEKFASLPIFNPKTSGWAKGAQLSGIRAQETTTPFLLVPDSLELRAGPTATAPLFRRGEDYEIDPQWGTIGRLTTGLIKAGQPGYASYRHAQLRLDAVIRSRTGQIILRPGNSRAAAPQPPSVETGEKLLAHIWLPGQLTKLTSDNLFPILETAYPESPKTGPSVAERLTPQALKKLKTGERLRILAWGDSVTDASYLPNPALERWQEQFVTRLRQRFPRANIALTTEAWGGRNTASYLHEPPGSHHNYQEKVIGAKPDLVISEFVNDAGLKPEQVEERYTKLLTDFQSIGAEWIILTPHYVRPDWMGLTREREVDEDPRPYVAGLRTFAREHKIALADAARRYGRLWRQGIPHSTIMLNSINHPNADGMTIFADALMELFP